MALDRWWTGRAGRGLERVGDDLSRRWHRVDPAMLLAVAFVISLLGLYGLGRSAQELIGRANAPSAQSQPDVVGRSKELTRLGWSAPGVAADVLLATTDYFELVGWTPSRDMNPRDHLIFVVAENVHDGDLPTFVAPDLRIDGAAYGGARRTHVLADSPHHRTTAVIFDRPEALDRAPVGAVIELTFPGAGAQGEPMRWDASVVAPTESTGAPFQLTGASILALLAGLAVSMWPCLFQLTVYFIPTLAGISVSDATGGVSPAAHRRVITTAGFFVLGFVVLYTLAGAATGLAAQSFDTRSILETWRRPLTIVAGLSMLALGVRQAARGRLPLACKSSVSVSVTASATAPTIPAPTPPIICAPN